MAYTEPYQQLSRRERQIMQIVFARGNATAKEIVEAMKEAGFDWGGD